MLLEYSLNIPFPVVEEAIKAYLLVSLTEEIANSLCGHLGMAEVSGRLQPNLGKVVLCWVGSSGDWEVRELVEGLVFTRTLGRHTTALCSAHGKLTHLQGTSVMSDCGHTCDHSEGSFKRDCCTICNHDACSFSKKKNNNNNNIMLGYTVIQSFLGP